MRAPARFDPYVIDRLLPDLVGRVRQPSAFILYLYLSKRAEDRTRTVAASLQTIAGDTGLSKSAVQRAVRTLLRRRLIKVTKASPTAVPRYTVLRPWARR
jgi:DNA-binding MarR family transcriptional regulator